MLAAWFATLCVAQHDAGVEFVNARSDGAAVEVFWLAPARNAAHTAPQHAPPLAATDAVHIRCQFASGPSAGPLGAPLKTWGHVALTIRKDWAPLGAQRVLEMVDAGFFDRVGLFRAVSGFLTQFGAKPGNPLPNIADDPLRPELLPLPAGVLSFAGSGPNSRGQQLWLSLGADIGLGRQVWETPVGYLRTARDMQTLHEVYTGYGDMPQQGGRGPDPHRVSAPDGEAYLREHFPHLTWIAGCIRAEGGAGAVEEAQHLLPPQREEVPVGAVQPGATVRHKSFAGHTFTARVRGELLGRFTVAGDESTVEFTADGGFFARPGSSSAGPGPSASESARKTRGPPPPGLERDRDL